MLVQDERGRLCGKASGSDFVNKIGCPGDVGADADSAGTMTLAVDDLSLFGGLCFIGLADGQGAKADEKITEFILFLPG
jgi:hypothetical protein